MLVVVGDIVSGSPLQLNAGSLRLGGSLNGRVINFNGGGTLIPDNHQSDGPVTTMLQSASAQLAAQIANNTAQLPSGQPGPARFNVTSVTADGAAIFEVAADQLFNNGVQQIELNPGSASMVIINVTGSTVNWTSGNMVGSFTDLQARSRIIWNFPQASTINFNAYNMMGAVLAPYAHVTTAANIDGAVAVRALTTTSEIHQPTLTAALGTLCDEESNERGCELVWLDWDGGLSSNNEVAAAILDPSQSGVRRIGETVAAGPVVENVSVVTNALDQWLNQPMRIALYDDGDQQNGYQICGFAELTMTEYEFSTVPAWLSGQFNVGLAYGETSTEITDYGLRGLYFQE
jgi:choice-of-anchor A domain-containing protein